MDQTAGIFGFFCEVGGISVYIFLLQLAKYDLLNNAKERMPFKPI
ncbi:MAG: hypothetical protein PHQ80_01000 [Candidatus ainarchaeum sp.]|nr:hypothetical protein [Candidatus ainarchaeum sp.]